MCQTPSNTQTDEETHSFVCFSTVSVSVSSVRPMAERTAMLHRNLTRGKNPGSTNKYTKFGQLIIGKINKKLLSSDVTFKARMTKFDSWSLSVCVLDGVFCM